MAAIAGLSWSVASFSSGRASRFMSAPLLTASFNFTGVILFASLFALSDESKDLTSTITTDAIVSGILGGLGFSLGLVCIARGMSRGRAGVISPLIGAVSIVIPLIFVTLFRERPSNLAFIGIMILLAVPWLASRSKVNAAAHVSRSIFGDVIFGVASGAGFGIYFIALILAPDSAQLLMLLILQFTSMVVMLAAHVISKATWKISKEAKNFFIIFIIFELIGVIFLRWSLNIGSPASISAVSGTLDPVGILILSAVFNKEVFTKPQLLSFFFLTIGIALAALGN